jgi:hypothetical protein
MNLKENRDDSQHRPSASGHYAKSKENKRYKKFIGLNFIN